MDSSPSIEVALVEAADTFRDSMEALYELVTLVNESAERLDNAKSTFERRFEIADPSVDDPGALYDGINEIIDGQLGNAARRRGPKVATKECNPSRTLRRTLILRSPQAKVPSSWASILLLRNTGQMP